MYGPPVAPRNRRVVVACGRARGSPVSAKYTVLPFVRSYAMSSMRMNWNTLLRLLQCSSTHCGPSGMAGVGGTAAAGVG